ncbi:hypothetical protein AHAT_06010 [Agarivorans sp. Toyoura001]|uniref:hypothetical protein n=1 Tax=Agarivorans sp. Toyoura001 TaxID=2283141 RepID=UPI0010E0E8D5|nr:hypothetical protein [Agarivorans sp. Toyoura001]GDY24711.1 hypothetical protein AHAT_06010 [Agarivorans sp. Toyoura001]
MKFDLAGSNAYSQSFEELSRVSSNEGKDEVVYYKAKGYLIVYRVSRGINNDTENQTEIPLSALPWIIQSITSDFWNENIPKTQHTTQSSFDNENIVLCRSMNAGAFAEKGFKIYNKSRTSHIMSSRPQAFQITDNQVKSILIPINDSLLKV